MLLLGTEKYPQENTFMEHLSKYGGVSQCTTQFDSTQFFYSISNEGLKESLDMYLFDFFQSQLGRLSQFFISPLFTFSGANREIKAIDSGKKINFQNSMKLEY